MAEDESRYEGEECVFAGGLSDLDLTLDADFKDLFVERTVSPKSSKGGKRRKKGAMGGGKDGDSKANKAPGSVTVIDKRRVVNVGIGLAKLAYVRPSSDWRETEKGESGEEKGKEELKADEGGARETETAEDNVREREREKEKNKKKKKENGNGNYDALATVLLRLDPKAMDAEQVNTLSEILPSADEIKQVNLRCLLVCHRLVNLTLY